MEKNIKTDKEMADMAMKSIEWVQQILKEDPIDKRDLAHAANTLNTLSVITANWATAKGLEEQNAATT